MVDIKMGLYGEGTNVLTQDLVIVAGDIALVSGQDEIVQNLKIRLWFYLGEYFLDADAGVPMHQNIFGKKIDIADIDRVYKVAILSSPDVISLESFTSEFDKQNRTYRFRFSVLTSLGVVEFENEGVQI
jgi:hypothetical protein